MVHLKTVNASQGHIHEYQKTMHILYTCVCASWIEFINFQQGVTYPVYYISVGSSTCFGCWHPSSAAGTAVVTASGID